MAATRLLTLGGLACARGDAAAVDGLGRFVVVDDGRAAFAIARRAYPRPYHALPLHRKHRRLNAPAALTSRGWLTSAGRGWGTRDGCAFLRRELAETGSNYCVCQFAFGDLSDAEIHRSVELFARDIMPGLAGLASLAAD
jgi:hypothetical protein